MPDEVVFGEWIQDPDYETTGDNTGMGMDVQNERRYYRYEVVSPEPDDNSGPLYAEEYENAISNNPGGVRSNGVSTPGVGIPDWGTSYGPFTAWGTQHFSVFPGGFAGVRYHSESVEQTQAFTASRVNERPLPIHWSPDPDDIPEGYEYAGYEYEDDADRSSVQAAILTNYAMINFAWEDRQPAVGGGVVIGNGLWETVVVAQSSGEFDVTGAAGEEVLHYDWNDEDVATAHPTVYALAGGHELTPTPLGDIDLTEYLFGSPIEGFLLIHFHVVTYDSPRPYDDQPDQTGMVFGGALTVADEAEPVGVRYTLRPPRYRHIFVLLPVEPTKDVVRQYPRDDGRGLSAASRRVPSPKARRTVGGYQ